MLGAPGQLGDGARVARVQGHDLDGVAVGVLPRPLRDAAGARREGHGVPERDELGGGRPSDASGAEDEVVGHGEILSSQW